MRTLAVAIVDQSDGTEFKSAVNADWRDVCGILNERGDQSDGVAPCGLMAMLIATELPPRTAAELEELSARLSLLSYVRPRVRALMEELVAKRRAYYVGPLAVHLTGARVGPMHPISGMVGQWEVAAYISEVDSRHACFLRNIQVGTVDSWDPSATEDELFVNDPPIVQ